MLLIHYIYQAFKVLSLFTLSCSDSTPPSVSSFITNTWRLLIFSSCFLTHFISYNSSFNSLPFPINFNATSYSTSPLSSSFLFCSPVSFLDFFYLLFSLIIMFQYVSSPTSTYISNTQPLHFFSLFFLNSNSSFKIVQYNSLSIYGYSLTNISEIIKYISCLLLPSFP